ncbi:hypothetical protein [Nonomuraea guangzhouensis]|uniref:Uncharacterized protein n=1 Tax=Nonomuraea guangzhouensis TaxID=1291555 RepID=A0ABW4GDJ8_9ACTN|nr:hypothetical protein [Nonomuraea guangzhouensis]
MAFDLVVQEKSARALYQPPFRLGRSLLELDRLYSLEDIARQRHAFAMMPDETKPFGYEFQTIVDPEESMTVESAILSGAREYRYDPYAQIWATSHFGINMGGIAIRTPHLTATCPTTGPDSHFDNPIDANC